jgi:hypothetical protein
VERGWRDFKGALGLRPVFHHREDRIRAHIQLCWLALLLLRVIENATGDTWRNARRELDRMHLVTLATNAGQVALSSPAFFGPGSYWSYATSWLFNQASWTSCGVRYPSPEWILLEL